MSELRHRAHRSFFAAADATEQRFACNYVDESIAPVPAHQRDQHQFQTAAAMLTKPMALICSEDVEFYMMFSHILGAEGFLCELAGSAQEAVEKTASRAPKAVIIDCQPTSTKGPAICTRFKVAEQTSALSIIAVIAPGAERQHLELLKTGVDETFVRPFAPAKLISYLRSRLSMAWSRSESRQKGQSLTCGDLEVQFGSRSVRCNGKHIPLRQIEFNLLRHLMENRGNICRRDDLIGAAWPSNVFVDARTVDAHICRLRRELKIIAVNNVIRTVRPTGYTFEEHNNWSTASPNGSE
ncbi:response regulator transcription factor [Paraburkholderia phymatum]|uniref:Response regulator transcription factor n=1 Tax=Paraburkholderia phymatum TaxID=148447 RepID=A0ACC6U7Y3_9BURK